MSAVPVFTLYCDGGGCREQFTTSLRYLASTAKEVRTAARGSGWTRARRGSGWLGDLCPACTKRLAGGAA